MMTSRLIHSTKNLDVPKISTFHEDHFDIYQPLFFILGERSVR